LGSGKSDVKERKRDDKEKTRVSNFSAVSPFAGAPMVTPPLPTPVSQEVSAKDVSQNVTVTNSLPAVAAAAASPAATQNVASLQQTAVVADNITPLQTMLGQAFQPPEASPVWQQHMLSTLPAYAEGQAEQSWSMVTLFQGFGLKGKRIMGRKKTQPTKLCGDLWEAPRQQQIQKLVGEEDHEGQSVRQWVYPIRDESRRSFAGLRKCPFRFEETSAMYEMVQSGTPWEQHQGPFGPLQRKTAWMVSNGCECKYRFGLTDVSPLAYPPWMVELMGRVMPLFGIKEQAGWPTSCTLNLYEDGGMAVGWHADDERLFQGKHKDIRILSLSLGMTRTFEVQAVWPEENESRFTMQLGNGDLNTMEGMMQKHYMHRITKAEHVTSPRINLTWRWLHVDSTPLHS